MDKIELLKRIRDEKWELYNLFDEKGEKELANTYYWESRALAVAVQILTNDEYFHYRANVYK